MRLQAYAFNRYTLMEAIEKTARASGRVIEMYPGQALCPNRPDIIFDQQVSDEIISDVLMKLGEDVIAGKGVGDVPTILEELKRQNFGGHISIEYEANWYENVTDVAQIVGFIRGWANTRDVR